MANFTTALNNLNVAAAGAPYRLSWSGSSSSPSPASPRPQRDSPGKLMMRSVVKVEAMMGVKKYKGTQMREKQLTEMIEKKVIEAKEVCGEDQSSDECKVAWDEVEEVSQAKADLRLKLQIMHQDPLESFCQENPETDECRIYED